MSAQSRVIFLEAEIKRLQAEIMALRCCGNCAKWKECWQDVREVPGMDLCYRWEPNAALSSAQGAKVAGEDANG